MPAVMDFDGAAVFGFALARNNGFTAKAALRSAQREPSGLEGRLAERREARILCDYDSPVALCLDDFGLSH